jgi:hypothetical protein
VYCPRIPNPNFLCLKFLMILIAILTV